ncbi:MAG: hypothetical protein Q9202_006540 [Teloschistes flavicans]
MFRNNYDNDTITFSPQGRIFQIEYASEAVKQGSVTVGLCSKTHVVLVALKIIAIDNHLGLALAGLASDARVLSNFMKRQALASKMTYGRPIPVERIVDQIGDRAQSNTQNYSNRPYGVGLLVAGVDDTGPHLFEFQPSGMTQEMAACAIGARSQMARTYLERNLDQFADCGREELVAHGLRALKESLSQDKELTVENASVGVVGVGGGQGKEGGKKRKLETFRLYDGEEMGPLLEKALEGGSKTEGEGGEAQTESMDTS